MSLFDFGLEWAEPNVWDVCSVLRLRIYDRKQSYFACWDYGSPFAYGPLTEPCVHPPWCSGGFPIEVVSYRQVRA